MICSAMGCIGEPALAFQLGQRISSLDSLMLAPEQNLLPKR
jgi:hypothetical protein